VNGFSSRKIRKARREIQYVKNSAGSANSA